jgi:hypothetical protein
MVSELFHNTRTANMMQGILATHSKIEARKILNINYGKVDFNVEYEEVAYVREVYSHCSVWIEKKFPLSCDDNYNSLVNILSSALSHSSIEVVRRSINVKYRVQVKTYTFSVFTFYILPFLFLLLYFYLPVFTFSILEYTVSSG